ncbi:MAG: M1 family aminopeptidase [Bacteroidota bacterium]
MKWFQIFKFELSYRLKRPVTYIYFILVFAVTLIALSSNIPGRLGAQNLVKYNAPTIIAITMAVLSILFMVITSAIMGVPILRDKEHNMSSLMYVNPMRQIDYLGGRFIGSFTILIFIYSGCLFGAIISPFVPWAPENMQAFNAWHYIHPFITIILSNLFFTGALFFMSGALSKKTLFVYTQGIIILALYEMMDGMANNVETKSLVSLIDPLLLHAVLIKTEYWSAAEQNTQVVAMTGPILINRIIWFTVGVLSLIATYAGFKFNTVGKAILKKKVKKTSSAHPPKTVGIPLVHQVISLKSYVFNTLRQMFFYYKMVVKDIPFIAIMITASSILVLLSLDMGREFGNAHTYATSFTVIEAIDGFNIFFIIILIFYSGELIWKERNVKANLIQDAVPLPNAVNLAGKFLAMVAVLVTLTAFLMLSGILIQLAHGFHQINVALYINSLFIDMLSKLVLFTVLAFFVQVMVNHKFLGFALMILFFMSTLVLNTLGIEHGLLHYGQNNLGIYSEMNGFGHFFEAFSWFNIYWFGLAIVLFSLSVLFAVRGTEVLLKLRIKQAAGRASRPILILGTAGLLTFALSGCYIYYNTNVLNSYATSNDQKQLQANYEKDLKQFHYAQQPHITDVNMSVDIYPQTRDYDAEGTYILTNHSDQVISELHLSYNRDYRISVEEVSFSQPATLKQAFDQYQFYIYALESPLQPGDTMTMHFRSVFRTEGFVYRGSSTRVVFNGTFFDNAHFPLLGYDVDFELVTDNQRAKYDLPPRERMLDRDDPRSQRTELFGGNNINFEITVSTDTSQIALAPGYLQKEWTEGDRKHFHYAMDVPMEHQYSIMSADYEVLRDKVSIPLDSGTKEVDLEIYYHEGHEYNVHRMMNAMKKSLRYYSEQFSPYQYRQMRILEFPRYGKFAQSFPNTVPFSEGIGFMMNIGEDDVDIPFFVTAHELGHQWWGDQVVGAAAKGMGMIIESLTHYSAAMVTRREYDEEHLHQIMLYELNRYLSGRKQEAIQERPLALVEDQQYIHYGKGLINMYALQDYVSEDSVNMALRRLANDWSRLEDKHPTTQDVIQYFREVTPDSLQCLVTDLFEKIILFENKANEVTYTALPNGSFEVTIDLSAAKYESDGSGASQEIDFKQWIDIGVYTEGTNGKEQLIYLEKHPIHEGAHTIKVIVPEKPSRAGIDPLNKLIDRSPLDNVLKAKELVGS